MSKLVELAEMSDYCSLCRTGHLDGRRHLYSPSHRAAAGRIVQRMKDKFANARALLTVRRADLLPRLPRGVEQNPKWCWFCQSDITPAKPDCTGIVLDEHILCHMASARHAESVKLFFVECAPTERDCQDYFTVSESLWDRVRRWCHKLVVEIDQSSGEKQIATAKDSLSDQQHPTGRAGGVRVWGGGLHATKPEDMREWKIDLLEDLYISSSYASAGAKWRPQHSENEFPRWIDNRRDGDWLPEFGRPFQTGSRKASLREHREELRRERKRRKDTI